MQADKTVDSCFMLPILPHKVGNVRDFWDDVSEKFRGDMEDQLKGVGVRRLLAFLQAMPEKGDFVIMYMESSGDLTKSLREMFATDTGFSKYLTGQFKDFTGLDMSKEKSYPQLQLVMDWKDEHEYLEEKDMLKMPWCFAAPIVQGRTDDLLKLLDEIVRSRIDAVADAMRHHDIIRSLAYLQRNTPQGDFIVRHILASNPLDDMIMSFTACDSKACKYVKDTIKQYTGLDFSDPKQLPHVELLFKWDESHGFETAEQTIAYTE